MAAEYDSKLVAGLPLIVFMEAIKFALWADKASEFGMEVAYHDSELILFRKMMATQTERN